MFRKTEKACFAAALMAVFALAACGGDDAGQRGPAAGAPTESPVDAATAGMIMGSVTFAGTPPAPQPIDMADEPVCVAKHDTTPVRETVVVGDGGGLANVFVYVKSGPVTEMRFPISTEQPVLDQDGCIYHPHVIGVQTGQTLVIRNSDGIMHNVNASPSEQRGFNINQPVAMDSPRQFATPEIMIPVRCDVHGWMVSYVGVTAHPYHAVTEPSGAFTLDNLPPGDYEIEAWHERYGTLTQNVTIPPSGHVDVSFEFRDGMAGRPVPMAEPMVVDHQTGQLRRAGEGAAHAHPGNQ